MQLTLFIPELIWPEPNDQLTLGKLALPGFEWLNARCEQQNTPRQACEAALAACFGLPDAAYAPLRLLGEHPPQCDGSQAKTGVWLCADPVHLRFHHERIVLADAGAFEVSEDEAQTLIAALNQTFADIGQFIMATPRRWYLHLAQATTHRAEPLTAIAGRRLAGDPLGAKSPLAGVINEIQMFLHTHPVNQQREASGQPSINSLWLWGAGSLPALEAPGFDAVWSRDPLAQGLARAASLRPRPSPPSLAALLDNADPVQRQLVVLEELLGPVLYEAPDDWKRAIQRLDADWFLPLSKAVGSQIKQLQLIAPTIYGVLRWQYQGGRWQFWKKGRTLAEIAQALASQPQASA